MNNMNRVLALLLSIVCYCAIGCNPSKPKDGFEISGKVAKPTVDGNISLKRFDKGQFVVIDSTKAEKDGSYRFIGKVAYEEFLMLDFYGKQTVIFIGDNKDITVNADGDRQDGKTDLKGTPDNENFMRVQALERKKEAELGPMRTELQLAAQNRDDYRMARYIDFLDRANVHYRARFKGLIDSVGTSLVSLYATHNLDTDKDFGFLDSLGSKFKTERPNAKWTQEFLGMLDERRSTAIGQPAPAFALPSLSRKTFLGTADMKGKVLLLDFWASWCKPCRANSPQMVALYKELKPKGLEILGVSLDNNRAAWEKAVAKDKYTWPQVSDLKMWEADVVSKYRIEGIPYLVLIDREGRIAAKGLETQAMRTEIIKLLEGNKAI